MWAVVNLLSLRIRSRSSSICRRGGALTVSLESQQRLLLQLADLGSFEDQHNDHLGWHARNIMAVAPEVCIFRVSNFHCAVQLLYLYIKSIC